MKYCTNCGNPLEESAAFCPSCGHQVAKPIETVTEAAAEEVKEAAAETAAAAEEAVSEGAAETAAAAEEAVSEAAEEVKEAAAPIAGPAVREAAPAEEPKKKKKGLKPIAIIAIVLAALAAIAGVLWGTGVLRKLIPDSRVKLGLAEKALIDKGVDEYFEKAKQLTDEAIKYDFNITAAIESEEAGLFSEIGIIKNLLSKFSIDLKLDVKDDHPNIGLGVNYSGNRVLDGSIITDGEKLGLYVPQLDSKYYVMNKDKLMQLATEDDNAKFPDLSFLNLDEAKTRAEIDKLFMIIGKLSTAENTVVEKDAEMKLYGGEKAVTGTRFTVTPSKEEFSAVIKELGEYLDSEESYFGGIVKQMAALASSIDGEEPEEGLFDELKNNSDKLAEDIMKEEPKLVAFMVGSDVVSNSVVFKSGSFLLDYEPQINDALRLFLNYEETFDFEGTKEKTTIAYDLNLTTYTDSTVIGTVKSSMGEGQDTLIEVNVSDIAPGKLTAKGTIKGSIGGTPFINITFTPEGETSKIAIEIDVESMISAAMNAVSEADDEFGIGDNDVDIDLDLDVQKIILNIIAAPGTGVEAPKDVEPTDLSNASTEEISEIFENMAENVTEILGSVLY